MTSAATTFVTPIVARNLLPPLARVEEVLPWPNPLITAHPFPRARQPTTCKVQRNP